MACRAEEKEGNLGSWLRKTKVILIIAMIIINKVIIIIIIILNLIIIIAIIIIRLNPSIPPSGMFYYIDQHRLLACLQPKVVWINVDHIIILFFMPTLPKVP